MSVPWYIHRIGNIYAAGVSTNVGSRWVQAVGEPYTAGRFLAAWWVLTGRAYALRWPVPGELEAAIQPGPSKPTAEAAE